MTDIEKLAKQIMVECEKEGEPVTIEEATEMAEMELKSKVNAKHYEQSKPKKSTTKERKVDEPKKYLFSVIAKSLEGIVDSPSLKNEVEYSFEFGGEMYTLKLTKHRKPKV